MDSTPPAPAPRPQDWTREVWAAAIRLLVEEDRRFADVAFRVQEDAAIGFLVRVTGPEELTAMLTAPGWNTVVRSFVRRAAKDMNRAETRSALEDLSWPPFLITLPPAPVQVAPLPPVAVQAKPMETPAVQSPQTQSASPSLLPAAAEPGPAPLRAHPFLDAAIPGEDAMVALVRGDREITEASEKMLRVCLRIWAMLDAKNRAYGNSALDPVRVFSKADAAEQIRVRLDDKLSRLARGHAAGEDVVQDFMGYLVLLKVAELPWPSEK